MTLNLLTLSFITLLLTSCNHTNSSNKTTIILEKDELKAFPTAFGVGANVSGGRGGEVYYVTRCDGGRKDNFDGTLGASLHNYDEAKVEHKNRPRTILFAVGGYFDTIYKTPTKERSLQVTNASNFTIAGQSTNYLGGVHLLGNVYGDVIRSFDGSDADGLKRVALHGCDNFIIRYISAKGAVLKPTFIDGTKTSTGTVLDLQNSSNAIVDHFSGGYGSYMLLFNKLNPNTNLAGNFTLQYSLSHEGWKEHNVVMPIGFPYTNTTKEIWNNNIGKYDIHHNAYILINHRQPANTNGGENGSFILSSNYTYDWGSRLGRHTGSSHVDLINNYYEKMDNLIDVTKLHKVNLQIKDYNFSLKPTFYAKNNLVNNKIYKTDEIFSNYKTDQPLDKRYIVNSPQTDRKFPVIQTDIEKVKNYNLSYCGAGVRFDSDGTPKQVDELDNLYIKIARDTKKIKKDEVGNIKRFYYPPSYLKQWMIDVKKIPPLESAKLTEDVDNNGIADWWESESIKTAWDGKRVDVTTFDKDRDGMPDWWEKIHGLNVFENDANGIKKSWDIGKYHIKNYARYSNLEIYLAHIAGDFHMMANNFSQ